MSPTIDCKEFTLHVIPPPATEEEMRIKEKLATLHRRYLDECEPWLHRLAKIQAIQAPHYVLAPNVAETEEGR